MRALLAGWVSLVIAGCGCGGGGEKRVGAYLPASGEVAGWTEDTAKGEAGPEETDQLTVAYEWVDGAMDTFRQHGWVALAREYYKNQDLEIALYIYQMSSPQNAAAVYDAIASYSGVTWTDTSFGGGEAQGRFGTVYTYCYADAVKGKYFLESTTKPASAEQAGKDFFKAVLLKLP